MQPGTRHLTSGVTNAIAIAIPQGVGHVIWTQALDLPQLLRKGHGGSECSIGSKVTLRHHWMYITMNQTSIKCRVIRLKLNILRISCFFVVVVMKQLNFISLLARKDRTKIQNKTKTTIY